MGPPAGRRHDPRAADSPAEQAGELLDDLERLRRSDAAAAADDDLRVAQRDAAARLGNCLQDARRSIVARRQGLHLDRLSGSVGVRRDAQDLRRPVQARFLEQAAAPAHPRHDVAVDRGHVRGEGLAKMPPLHGDSGRGRRLFTDNCVRCHKSGILPIFPVEGSVSAGEQQALLAVNERFLTYGSPRFDKYLVTTSCRSCHDPKCLTHCPVDAIHRKQGLPIIIENFNVHPLRPTLIRITLHKRRPGHKERRRPAHRLELDSG